MKPVLLPFPARPVSKFFEFSANEHNAIMRCSPYGRIKPLHYNVTVTSGVSLENLEPKERSRS